MRRTMKAISFACVPLLLVALGCSAEQGPDYHGDVGDGAVDTDPGSDAGPDTALDPAADPTPDAPPDLGYDPYYDPACPPPGAPENDYIEFSWFTIPGSMYCDVGSYLDEIFVHDMFTPRVVDVYKVLVTDMDKVDEAPLLDGPDGVYGTADDLPNTDYQERTLYLDRTINLAGGPNPNSMTNAEFYIDETGIYTLGGTGWYPGVFGDDVLHFDHLGNYIGMVVESNASGMVDGCCLGYDEAGGVWYMLSMSRGVYSSTGGDWVLEFSYADMAGDHGDGMEVAAGPDGQVFVYVSDMTSNFIGQWSQDDNPCTDEVETGWNEWNRFSYKEIGGSGAKLVEGMGLGSLGHFWVSTGDGDGALMDAVVYELGGGRIGSYLPPII